MDEARIARLFDDTDDAARDARILLHYQSYENAQLLVARAVQNLQELVEAGETALFAVDRAPPDSVTARARRLLGQLVSCVVSKDESETLQAGIAAGGTGNRRLLPAALLEQAISHIDDLLAVLRTWPQLVPLSNQPLVPVRYVRAGLISAVAFLSACYTMTVFGHGLRAEYFVGTSLAGRPLVSRVESSVYLTDAPGTRPRAVPPTEFSARWTGALYAPESGEYHLILKSDDSARLWLDGEALIDDWQPHAETLETAAVILRRGWHNIRLEYAQTFGLMAMKLHWARPGRSAEIVPTRYLRPAPAEGH